MTHLPRLDAGLSADWPDLAAEFDRCGEAGRVALLWWRDDDAIGSTPELAQLLRIAGPAPVALAVIPALAQPDLAEVLCGRPGVAVLQHGWRHANRTEYGKKSEYPAGRPAAAVAAELAAGNARVRKLFGSRAQPVFVPPWNRFASELLPLLPVAGITGFSTMVAQRPQSLPPGLAPFDVHVDVVDWRGDRGFIGTAAALRTLLGWLRAQRLGAAEPAPIGILTHHLVMDGAAAAFLDCLGAAVADHAAARWANIAELLP